MSKFRFLPEITTEGVAFEAFGKTERQLFENASIALSETIADTKNIRRNISEQISLRSSDLSELLLIFLDRIIFLKEAKNFLLKQAKVGVEKQGKSWVIQGYLYGEKYNQEKHKLKINVKSVSRRFHELKKGDSGCRAQVVLLE